MIYIQSNSDRTLPHHFDAACAMYGAIDSGVDFRLTSFEEVRSGKFDALIKTNLFVGSVEFMTEVFNRVGIANVKIPINSNRTAKTITLKEALLLSKSGTKLFIKPFQIKLFTGLVLEGYDYPDLNKLPDETLVMAYEPFTHRIVSEWRIYVYNNEMRDSHCYTGDFTVGPDYEYIKGVISQNASTFPIAYTIDAGILANYETVVIEFNDMWAIGNYGVENGLYFRVLKNRYFQIMKS